MARIPPKNERFRTKAEIARDVAFVLNSDLHYGTKYAVLKEVTWVWTEFSGKFNGCHYWTTAALRRFKREGSRKRLRHEHAVPKKVVIDTLLNQMNPTPESIRSLLNTLLIGVVVTKEEDARLNAEYGKSMPVEFEDETSPFYQDPWLRYRKCDINVRFMPQQTAAILPLLSKFVAGKGADDASLTKVMKALDRHGRLDGEFDWANWNEAEDYMQTPGKLDKADVVVIRQLMTLHFRKERFCEGHLTSMISSGHFNALIRRLRDLRSCLAFL